MTPSEQPSSELKVRVLAPSSKLYEGPAVSITATNKVGPFDILAGHANFFSLLSSSVIVINTGSQALQFPVSEGLLKVRSNVVTLFVNPKEVVAS